MSKSPSEKEKKLLDRIEKAKKDLAKLKQKRKEKIGELAIKAGLSGIDNQVLQERLAQLAQELCGDEH
jgi:hypothetical protein